MSLRASSDFRRLIAAVCLICLPAVVAAQTYVGNLDGTSVNSTFGNGGTTLLNTFGNGWSVISGTNVEVFSNTNNVVINTGGGGFESYTVSYISSTPLVANSTYTLSFDMGYVSGAYTGIATYAFELDTYNGGSYTVLNSTSGGPVLGGANAGAFSTYDPHIANTYVTQTLNFTTGASVSSDVIAIKWSSTNPGSPTPTNADYFGFDNVKLSYTAIPEPSTFAAIFGGLALVGAMIRHRRQAA